jgi:hypothetical protein
MKPPLLRTNTHRFLPTPDPSLLPLPPLASPSPLLLLLLLLLPAVTTTAASGDTAAGAD